MADTDLELAQRIARISGRKLLELRESYGPIDPTDPTDAAKAKRLKDEGDLLSHDLILEMLQQERPDDAVLSEEGEDESHRDAADRVWIVDPLDGTSEYGQGRADWAVQIALWERGKGLTVGALSLPAQDLYWSTGDEPLELALPTDEPLRIAVSRSRPPTTLAQTVGELSDALAAAGITDQGVKVLPTGSVGGKVNTLLTGEAHMYAHDTGFWEWDVAAPYVVAQHLGLYAKGLDGAEIEFNLRPPKVSTLLVCHPALAEIVRPILAT